ncbi:DUF1771 domain-containing protein [Candidatus Saccharibacteria bacterium]|nr:DUF1771 domain-containing protein [Candidatus Saccharibacteria bacterium]
MGNPDMGNLKQVLNQAYEGKEQARKRMDAAWDERRRLQKKSDSSWAEVQTAREAMNQAWNSQQSEWDQHKAGREAISKRIEFAKAIADRAYADMSKSFELASEAYSDEDHAAAGHYSSEGREHEEKLNNWNGEVKRLISIAESLVSPSSSFHSYKSIYESKMAAHERVKAEYQRAKQVHETAKKEFQAAQEKFKTAKAAFDKAKAADDAMWYDKDCLECGKKMRVRRDWERPSDYCKECWATFKRRREARNSNSLFREGNYVEFKGKKAKIIRQKVKIDKGYVDILFDGDALKNSGGDHGHITIDPLSDQVVYWRERDQSKNQANINSNKRKEHTKF